MNKGATLGGVLSVIFDAGIFVVHVEMNTCSNTDHKGSVDSNMDTPQCVSLPRGWLYGSRSRLILPKDQLVPRFHYQLLLSYTTISIKWSPSPKQAIEYTYM